MFPRGRSTTLQPLLGRAPFPRSEVLQQCTYTDDPGSKLYVYTIYTCISLSIGLSVYLSICLSVYLSICLSVCLSICLTVYPSTYPSIYLCIYPTYVSTYTSIYLSIHPSSIYLSVYLSVQLSFRLCISDMSQLDPAGCSTMHLALTRVATIVIYLCNNPAQSC